MSQGRKRILLVDDDRNILLLTTAVLHRLGVEPVCASSYSGAVNAWIEAKGAFDMAVLDYNLDGKTGFELAERFWCDNANLPVLIISGLLDTPVKVEKGRVEYIEKPFSIEVLSATIRRLLGLEQSRT